MRCGRIGLGATLATLLWAFPVVAGLPEYVRKPEPAFAWKLEKTTKLNNGTVYTLDMVSQTWQNIDWKHKVVVFSPDGVKPANTMLLLNAGGEPGGAMFAVALELTRRIGSPVAIVFGVPNQPLFGGKKEDALIAETFCRFLDCQGEDESWPLLFPMVKSVVKAMDAIQEFARREWQHEVKDFIVGGASKRGWTSWLTGAAEPRVRAIIPMVIDVVNMKPQMEYQVACYGKPSEMVHDYVERNLIPMPDNPVAKRLWSMVDPYFYRDQITMPKLIVNGANDPYWTVDALNLYWDDLKGDKFVCIVPNAGHDLSERPEEGQLDPLKARARVLNATAAFVKNQIAGKPMPKVSWKHADGEDGSLRLTIDSTVPPKGARVWVALSESKDFRQSRWRQHPAAIENNKVEASISPPPRGFIALFGEVDFDADGLTYSLSTQVRVAPAR
ncbi:MAG: PhoPQ-activated pathogenicity-related family protein [Gemmataceae bacterium]|nr:PhoPQ-activated pathogenicity-related family protein [Gemmataceae bacterium]